MVSMRNEGGFTLIEFMIAAAIAAAALGGTVMLATQLQQAYTTRLDDATVEEEARFALDWIAQALRNAGTNPYDISSLATSCAGGGTFTGIEITAGNSGIVRIHADINPPNGLIGGTAAGCAAAPEEGEDITIAHDPDESVITREDHSGAGGVVTMTEPVIEDLVFTFLNSSRNVTAIENQIAFVRVQIIGRSQAHNVNLGEGATTTLETEVRVRTR